MSITDPFKIPEGQRAGPVIDHSGRNIQPRSGSEESPLIRSNQFKMCPKAQRYESHPEHEWERRKNHILLCEGVPEEKDLPTCTWVMDYTGVMCKKPAPAMIRIKTSVADIRTWVCPLHKHMHDTARAANRQSSRAFDR